MPYSTSLTGYPDLTEVLDRALASAKGIRITLDNENEVRTFKGRVHSFRSLDRKENARIYPLGDPMHNRSIYDPLTLRSKGLQVEILKLTSVEFKMEEIT